jgi:hypothetical protein
MSVFLSERPNYLIKVEQKKLAGKYENADALERWLDALRQAGLPER